MPPLPIANPNECEFYRNNQFISHGPLFLFHFGATKGTKVYVWAGSTQDAFEIAVEWLDKNAPGHLRRLDETALRNAALALPVTWQPEWPDFDDPAFSRVVEHAEANLTSVGHIKLEHGQYLVSHEWGFRLVDRKTDEFADVRRRSLAAMARFARLDILEAWYLFASQYHKGQRSDKYEALSRLAGGLKFRPRDSLRSRDDLSENGRLIFDNLVANHEDEDGKEKS